MAVTTSGKAAATGTSTNLYDAMRIIIGEAMYTTEATRIMPNLVRTVQLPPGSYQINLPRFDRLSASALTEGVDLSSPQSIAVNIVTVIPGEHGVIATLTSVFERRLVADAARMVGRLLGDAMSRRLEQDLINTFDSFTLSDPGASSALGAEYIRGVLAYLKTENSTSYGAVPAGQIECVLHPEQIQSIAADIGLSSSIYGTIAIPSGFTDEVIRSYLVNQTKVFGVRMWEHPLVTRDTAGDAKGGMFHKEAIYNVEEGNKESFRDEDPSLRAVEYGMVHSWQEGILVDNWGAEIYSAADATVS